MIKAARDAKGWSQEKLAEKAGYKLSVIQKLEQGTYFSLRCLEACAEALEVLVADLLVSSKSRAPDAIAGSTEESAAGPSIVMQNRSWTVNLGYGFAFYLHCSGGKKLSPANYKRVAQMVSQPCQELGLQVSVLLQPAYSTPTVLKLGEQLAGELRLRNAHLASLFDFVWRVLLLLFSREDNHSAPPDEREIMEATLSRSARNAGLLDDYSSQVIRKLAWDGWSGDERTQAQDRFIHWVHEKVAGMD